MKKSFLGTAFVLMILMMCLLSSCSCKHEVVIDPIVESTCTETGLTEGSHCDLCGEVLTAQETIPAKGHSETIIAGKDATCTETGLTEGKTCTMCGETLIAQETIPAKGHTEEIRNVGIEATCTEEGLTDEKACSVCGVVLEKQKTIKALGHTTANGTCERCGKMMGVWAMRYYVDDFDMPTDKAYIYNKNYFTGTFSNSATTDSKLYAMILVDKSDISIFLYEYGRSQVKNSSSRYADGYDVIIRLSDGKKVEYEAYIYAGGDRMYFEDKDYNSIVNILKSGEEIAIYIVEQERTTTNYLFKVDTSNFADVFKEMK